MARATFGTLVSFCCCSALLPLACALDRRPLTLGGEDSASGTSSSGAQPDDASASDAGAASIGGTTGEDQGPALGGDASAPSEAGECVGAPGERRCRVVGGRFERGPVDARRAAQLSTFWLDEQEVTVARFRAFQRAFQGTPSAGEGEHPELRDSGWRSEWTSSLPASATELSASLHCNYDWETWSDEPGEREQYPLTCASYYVAFAFCVASRGRLPTELEWEYAAAGGAEQRPYPWGDAEPSSELAWFGRFAPAPAAHEAGRGRFGQLDLAGSVEEWALDYFAAYPQTCEPCAELDGGSERVLRGGSFAQDATFVSSFARNHLDPALPLANVGIRCAYDD